MDKNLVDISWILIHFLYIEKHLSYIIRESFLFCDKLKVH